MSKYLKKILNIKKKFEFNNKFIYTIYFELKNKYKFIQFGFSGGANNNLIWFAGSIYTNF